MIGHVCTEAGSTLPSGGGGGGAFRFPKTVFEMSLRETQISMFAPPRAPI